VELCTKVRSKVLLLYATFLGSGVQLLCPVELGWSRGVDLIGNGESWH